RDFGISYSAPYSDIPRKVRDILMYGTDRKGDGGTGTEFERVIHNLQRRFETTQTEWVKARLFQYQSEQPCETCSGTRLKPEVLAVRLHTVDSVNGNEGGLGAAAESSNGKNGDDLQALAGSAARVNAKTGKP